MTAGRTQLKMLKDDPQIYTKLNEKGAWFFEEVRRIAGKPEAHAQVSSCGSLGCIFFTDTPVVDYESAKTSDTARYAAYCKHMMERGVYLAPSQFEAMFLSASQTKEELTSVLEKMEEFF